MRLINLNNGENKMEETKSGISPTGLVILLVLLFLFMRQGGLFCNGFGWGGNGFPAFGCGGISGDFGFQNYKATCDAEKAEIINTARTQFLVEQSSAATQAAIKADGDATRTKINFYAYQELRDKLAEMQRINSALESKLYTNAQFDVVNKELAEIKCKMLPKPDITAFGASCTPVLSPLSLYASALNHSGCGYGCGNTLGI